MVDSRTGPAVSPRSGLRREARCRRATDPGLQGLTAGDQVMGVNGASPRPATELEALEWEGIRGRSRTPLE